MIKNIYIIQNSEFGIEVDIAKLYRPDKYRLFYITNDFGLNYLKKKKQDIYFEKIFCISNFNINSINETIKNNQNKFQSSLQIITNDETAITICGKLRQIFKLDDHNYDRFKNKIIMKDLINKKGLLAPKHILFDPKLYFSNSNKYIDYIVSDLSFPLMIKPIDAMGCLGIQKIGSREELEIWCANTVFDEIIYEIDEYITGKVYICDSFIRNHNIIYTQISECLNSCYDFICGLTKGSIVIPKEHYIGTLLENHTKEIHAAIGIPEGGVTHLEVIVTNDNKIYFLEIGHRSPGILIPAMYKRYLGINTVESHFLLQINSDFKFNIVNGEYAAWLAFPTKRGALIEKHPPQLKSQFSVDWQYKVGERMSDPNFGRDYAGKMLLWNSDYLQLKNDFISLNRHNFFDIEPVNLAGQI